MNIRQLIDSLNVRAAQSDLGYETEVTIQIHAGVFNTTGSYVEAPIVDVCNAWGHGLETVEIDVVPTFDQIDRLAKMKKNMFQLYGDENDI